MAWRCCPACSSAGSGTIVFVSSMGGRIPIANEAAYNAAKFAMGGWAEAMCLDLDGTGVEVKLVLPGPIDTEIWDQPGNEPALFDDRQGARRRTARPASSTRSRTTASSTTCRRCSPAARRRRRLVVGKTPGRATTYLARHGQMLAEH